MGMGGGMAPHRAEDVQIIRLANAEATTLAETLNQIYAPGQSGIRVTSDQRTNSLLVAGSEQQIEALRKLVSELDQPVKERPMPRDESRRKKEPDRKPDDPAK
jgi:type II secretory pathway component GspD/PulD (secretin)